MIFSLILECREFPLFWRLGKFLLVSKSWMYPSCAHSNLNTLKHIRIVMRTCRHTHFNSIRQITNRQNTFMWRGCRERERVREWEFAYENNRMSEKIQCRFENWYSKRSDTENETDVKSHDEKIKLNNIEEQVTNKKKFFF